MAKFRNWRKILVSGAALLMFTSVGMPTFNYIASAKRRPHAARQIKHKKASRDDTTASKAPWKKAWNKYLAEKVIYTSSAIFPDSEHAARLRITGPVQKRPKSWIKGWERFFKRHTSKKALKASSITYPHYQQIGKANENLYDEKKGKAYILSLPSPTWNHHQGSQKNARNLNDIRNAELLANKPLHRFTPHMRKALKSVAIPAHNKQAILTSFSLWMSRTHQHPKIRVGNVPYVYQGKHFVATKGTNGYGVTYKFNTKTNHYERVSSKNAAKNINKERNKVEKQTTQTTDKATQIIQQILPQISKIESELQANKLASSSQPTVHTDNDSLVITGGDAQKMLQDIENNSQLSDATKATAKKLIQDSPTQQSNNNQQTSPIVALAQAASNNQLSQSEQNKAAYMANTATKQLQPVHYVVIPPVMDSTDAAMSTTPKATAKQAAQNGPSNNTQGLITNDPATAQNAAILKDEIANLANQLGIAIPKGTTMTF